MKDVILASTSVYRKQQLSRLNINFSTVDPDVDESLLKTKHTDHIKLSQELSLLKARSVSKLYKDAVVIGGDQVASFNKVCLSKPKTKAIAFEQLKMLNSNKHQLITSLAIIADGKEYIHTCVADMIMRSLKDEQLLRYIEKDNPLNSCGSYRIESLGISLFKAIDCSDYTAVIGIPLMWTADTLNKLGVVNP